MAPPAPATYRVAAAVFLALLAGCTPETTHPDPPEVVSRFTVPTGPYGRQFLDVPWPCDVDVAVDGTRNMDAFPNPSDAAMLEEYRLYVATGRGWSLNGAIFLGFGGPLDPATLPANPSETLLSGSPVQLLDVDPASPEQGTRYPLRLRWYAQATDALPAHALVALPVLGFPLRPGTTYALVVTRPVTGARGGRVDPSPDLAALLSVGSPQDARLTRAHQAFQPLRSRAAALGITLAEVVHATVFTTVDPWPQMDAARGRVVAGAPYPVSAWTRPADHATHTGYDVYEGLVTLPQFQAGTPPFTTFDGVLGGFVSDQGGVPTVQRQEALKFALTVPRGPAPAGGWPLVVMAHGTGGDYRTGIGDRYGDEAAWLTRAGCAGVMISQPLHRTRQGYREGTEELATFNFLNPRAGTDNWRQSALESVALLHSLDSFTVPAEVSATGAPIPFKTGSKLFFGHSQGGLTGAIMAGVAEGLHLAVFSGAGGGFAESLLEKKEPNDIAALLKVVLGLPEETVLDEFHPVLSLVQLVGEGVEPLNAARRFFSHGREAAPHLLVLSGLVDQYTPPRTHGPLAAAAGIPLLAPRYQEVEALTLRGLDVVTPPVSLNVLLEGDRRSTSVLAQFPNSDHFAVYSNPSATDLVQGFVESYVTTGVATATR
jgi:hypothetical protein